MVITDEIFKERMRIQHPNIEVLDTYINAKTKVLCRCKIDGYEWYGNPDHFQSGRGCPKCGRRSAATKKNKKPGEKFLKECYEANPNIEIISTYTGCQNEVICRCKICKQSFPRIASKAREGRGCPVCANVLIIPGYNDLATTHPEFIRYFKDKSLTQKYSYGSPEIVDLICPDCGTEKRMSICLLTQYGFVCQNCGDGISYPNKFARSLLKQLNVKSLKFEYSPSWAKPYRYDCWFVHNNQEYILEMDGGFHYQKYYNSNKSLEETQRIDKLKDDLAEQHNIKMIRVDCKISTFRYIKEHIENSYLAEIFDLSIIDFDFCNKDATKSIVKQVCDYYLTLSNPRATHIAKTFGLTATTISKYLYKGTELGFCNYIPFNRPPSTMYT